jgi:hypothetical protein
MATGGKKELTKLTKKATAKGLWFYSRLLKHWWSPDALQAIYTARAFRQDAGPSYCVIPQSDSQNETKR